MSSSLGLEAPQLSPWAAASQTFKHKSRQTGTRDQEGGSSLQPHTWPSSAKHLPSPGEGAVEGTRMWGVGVGGKRATPHRCDNWETNIVLCLTPRTSKAKTSSHLDQATQPPMGGQSQVPGLSGPHGPRLSHVRSGLSTSPCRGGP